MSEPKSKDQMTGEELGQDALVEHDFVMDDAPTIDQEPDIDLAKNLADRFKDPIPGGLIIEPDGVTLNDSPIDDLVVAPPGETKSTDR
jgi:hypothetical protein